MSQRPKNDDATDIAAWEEQAARKLLTATAYEDRMRLYSEIYDHDNAYWLECHGRTGISGECARNQRLLQAACPGNGPILDIGGGIGVAGEAFPLTREYVVCDASPLVKAQAATDAGTRRVTTGYATALPFPDGSFEAVLMLDVLEHLHSADIDLCLDEILRVLRPSGRLLLATPNRISGPWDGSRKFQRRTGRFGLHLNEMSVSRMITLLRRHDFTPLGFQTRRFTSRFVAIPPLWLWAALLEGMAYCIPWRHRPRLCPLAVVLAKK